MIFPDTADSRRQSVSRGVLVLSLEERRVIPDDCCTAVHVIWLTAASGGLPAADCLLAGDGAKYAGQWKRDLYGEGEVHMKLASNGGVELMLPRRGGPTRWT